MNSEKKVSALWFEGRELSPAQLYVDETELREGEIYFTVSFLDEEMLVPDLTPVVFIGRHLEGDDAVDLLYFQDYDSYRQGVRSHQSQSNVTGVRATIFSFNRGESTDMCNYETALESLLKCSLRRSALRT